MDKAHISYLFEVYLDNAGTPGELTELESILRDPHYDEILKTIIDELYFSFTKQQLNTITDNIAKENSFNYIIAQPQNSIRKKLWPRIATAASILLFLSIAGYFLLRNKPVKQTVHAQQNDIVPGGNKAILTLSNGRQIVLNGAKNGILTKEDNLSIINKTQDGVIAYKKTHIESRDANSKVKYNTIAVPTGGIYKLILSDGTKIWLNALSSLKYPTSFKGKERTVEMKGEAYFEVAHNKKMPFRVRANGQTVKVLGTHFNINAYQDEGKIKTDLLEGSVEIYKNNKSVVLKPGQEATILFNQPHILIKSVDVQTAIAWKNGFFSFKRSDLKVVMRQISRWYDVEVLYEGEIPVAAITGTVDRSTSVFKVLQIIKSLGISFKIEGKKIIINQKIN